MSLKQLRIATRKSPLALWQAEFVRDRLLDLCPDLDVQLIKISTQGDRILDRPLSTIGGKGLFIKELEQKLIDNTADIAVHSMKDVTIDMLPGMALPVILKREDPRDVLIANDFTSLDDLPAGACVGTSSLRRQSQLAARRPDLQIKTLRGNVGTRLKKLDAGDYDAIVLAAAGMARLKLQSRIRQYLEPDIMLPAIGQGAIGIETRANDQAVIECLQALDDSETRVQLLAERAFSRRLYGSCKLPIAAYAELTGDALKLSGLVASVDGRKVIADHIDGTREQAEVTGLALAERLLKRGADKILREVLYE
ncbi:MAG TPA: hydroxymethylbilane synthase [Gammaproteobacteria bacterium]|nr:hydroxymethylbilane synthase [Gammaproteobacteria bacterium]